jgi:hypothetical protein
VLGPEHYSARASELEEAANLATDRNIKATYRELARRFRDMADMANMANMASVASGISADDEKRVTERLVGKTPPRVGDRGD